MSEIKSIPVTLARRSASTETPKDEPERFDNQGPTLFMRWRSYREASAAYRNQRDLNRGYSINTKQVVLAFAVEFFIISLILVGQYLIAEEAAGKRVFSILLFPVALAVVELARVPLAIAVRTQTSWPVKFFAALGVFAAIVVTSFSLSTIAYQTFDPRLLDANEAGNNLHYLMAQKESVIAQQQAAQSDVQAKTKARDSASERLSELQSQITKISSAVGKHCKPTTNSDGTPGETCSNIPLINRQQMNALQSQIVLARQEFDAAEAALKAAEAAKAALNPTALDQKIAAAEIQYRRTVSRSQLHSYTSYIVRKPPAEVTDAEVKALESYLIFIPSIAAAFASTLLAITAVRRLKLPPKEDIITMPDEAAAYLFGPLVNALKKEASDAVAAALKAADAAKPERTKEAKSVA
jgi:hypothetical protein